MSIEIAAVVLLAAAFHATWNALIKIRGDRVVVMMLVTLAGSVFSLLVAPFVEAPAPESWGFLAATILLHTAYHFFLPIAYNHGDLGQVYPIARGSAPLLVAIGALVFVGESLTPLGLLGTLCLACGVMALAFERERGLWRTPKPVIYALLTGVLIASYTVVDGMGARQAGSAIGFAVWLTIGDGLLTFLIVYIWKGRHALAVARRNMGAGVLGGVLQAGGYWIIVWALAVAPMAMVSGLRETSVLFVALISTFVLKEGFGVWRFVSASLIALGLVATKAAK
jgi:drug/metabolite transporter (DMT)-like permease